MEKIRIKTPIGPIEIWGSKKGISWVRFLSGRTLPLVRLKPSLQTPQPIRQVQKWLQRYFEGGQKEPFLWKYLDLAGGTYFQKKVWRLLWKIPHGQTRTYGLMAKKLKIKKGGAQAVGQANRKNPVPILVPCHRVVAAGGSLGGYAPGLSIKKNLLKHEGIVILSDRREQRISRVYSGDSSRRSE